jgi:hypothetical protein
MIPSTKNSARCSTHFSTVYREVADFVMGADINAKLGRPDSDELSLVLGPHEPSCQNTRGTNLFSLYLSNGLRIENTFFVTPSHKMFTNINDDKQTMINVFVCSQQLHCQVHNCRIMLDGVESNTCSPRSKSLSLNIE